MYGHQLESEGDADVGLWAQDCIHFNEPQGRGRIVYINKYIYISIYLYTYLYIYTYIYTYIYIPSKALPAPPLR